MPDLECLSVEAPRVLCNHCNANLSALPPGARYCRRCGVRLSGPVPRPLAHAGPPRRPGLLTDSAPWWLWWLWGGAPRAQESAFADRSAMLLAYARSMFGLGWRYEHAIGSRRNLDEAARCYTKAARLGNASAVGRLSGQATASGQNQPPPL